MVLIINIIEEHEVIMTIQTVIEAFNQTSISPYHVIKANIKPHTKANNQHTYKGACGIVIPISGKATYRFADKSYTLERGSILFAGSGFPIDKEVMGDQNWQYYLVHYVPKEQDSMLYNLHFDLKVCKKRALSIISMAESLERLFEEKTDFSQFKCKNTLSSMVENILECALCYNKTDETVRVETLVKMIHDNYHLPLSNAWLADYVSWDMKQMHYYFTKVMGVSPRRYLIQYRMKQAKYYLADSQMTVTEIAQLVGYEDPFHFSKLFKKQHGISPSVYRRRLEKSTW